MTCYQGRIASRDDFVVHLDGEPCPVQSNGFFAPVSPTFKGISKLGGAVDLSGVGWHPPSLRSLQLNAARRCAVGYHHITQNIIS